MSYFYISGSLKGWVSFTKKCKPILVIRIKMKFEASLEHESFAWLFMHNLGLVINNAKSFCGELHIHYFYFQHII
jgi:hypothetical protein